MTQEQDDLKAIDEEFARLMRESEIRHKALMASFESMREKLWDEYRSGLDSPPND
jgi:hypothetical protein